MDVDLLTNSRLPEVEFEVEVSLYASSQRRKVEFKDNIEAQTSLQAYNNFKSPFKVKN